MALPTITPSEKRLICSACSGVDMPKPTAQGISFSSFTSRTNTVFSQISGLPPLLRTSCRAAAVPASAGLFSRNHMFYKHIQYDHESEKIAEGSKRRNAQHFRRHVRSTDEGWCAITHRPMTILRTSLLSSCARSSVTWRSRFTLACPFR